MNEARERFGTYLTRIRSGTQPAAVEDTDPPPAAFLRSDADDGHTAGLTIHYADADLAVLSRSTASGAPQWGVVGVDPFRDGNITGIPLSIGDVDVAGWTRQLVLDQLRLDSWNPVPSATTSTLPFNHCRRFQGRVGVVRVTRNHLEQAWENIAAIDTPDGPLIRNENESKTISVGDQMLFAESAGELNRPHAYHLHSDPHRGSTLKLSEGTRVWIDGNHYERRSLTVPDGVYTFFPLAQSPSAGHERAAKHPTQG